jgi:hypothetical protein
MQGLLQAPEGKVVQYVVNCGEMPNNECLTVLSFTPIYTDVSELGFQLKDPESIRQYKAAVQTQRRMKENMKASGQLQALEKAAMNRYLADVHSGKFAIAQEQAQQMVQAYNEARQNQ